MIFYRVIHFQFVLFTLLLPFSCQKQKSKLLRRSLQKERQERFTTSLSLKKSKESVSLHRPLQKERITVLLFCSQKTSNLHEKPKSEFLTLKVAKYLWGVSFMDCSRKMLQTFLITCLLIYIKY